MEVFLRTALLGLVTGSIYAMSATGLVLTFKTSGILNLGYGALALFTTLIHWQFTVHFGWPVWMSALVVVLVIAPLIGIFLDIQLFRRIEGQPMVIGLMATVGLFVLLLGIVLIHWGNAGREVPSLFPQRPIAIPGGGTVGLDGLLALGVSAAAAGLLAAMLRFTRLGVAFRAVVDNRPVAGLMAINTGFVSASAWALATSFVALSGILLAPLVFILEPRVFPFTIISFVLGAAMVGYLRSLPLAYAGGLLLGLIQAYLVQYSTSRGILGNLGDAAPFVLMTVLVLAAPKAIRLAGMGTSFMVKTREVATQASPRTRAATAGVVFAALALVPVVTGLSWKLNLLDGLTQAIIFLSIVILTGYSGQISLGHTAFIGLATFTTAHLAANAGVPIWLAFALGVLAAVPAGALIGIIAVRLHGIFLALITLALAFMAQELFFQEPSISGPEGVLPVPRPAGFTGNDAFYYLTLGILLACVVLAANLRSGRTGRILAAMRDSETATRSLGINVVKYKVVIFSLSAGMAALGGILHAMYPEQVSGRFDFIPFLAIFYVTIAVVGGIFHIGGALAAGILTGIFAKLSSGHPTVSDMQLILFGLGATLALAQNPEGMFGELRRAGNGVLRTFARRQTSPEPLPVAGGQE